MGVETAQISDYWVKESQFRKSKSTYGLQVLSDHGVREFELGKSNAVC